MPSVLRSEFSEAFSPKPPAVGKAWAIYCRIVSEWFGKFTLEGLLRTQQSIDLREIYVPLLLGEKPVDDARPEDEIAADALGIIDCLVRNTNLVIAGPPGSGKTTLVRELVLELASTAENSTNRSLRDVLPIPVFLREYPIDSVTSIEALIDMWFQRVAAASEGKLIVGDLSVFLQEGRFLLLLDGLDELGSVERRGRVCGMFNDFLVQKGATGRLSGLSLITTRPSGLDGIQTQSNVSGSRSKDSVALFAHRVYVRPLTQSAVRQFCVRWFQLPGYRDPQTAKGADDLLGVIEGAHHAPHLRTLSRRPAFLTMMAFVQATVGRLPDTRAQLYETLVDAYLHQLDEVRRLLSVEDSSLPVWPREDKRVILAALGYSAQLGVTRREQGKATHKAGRLFAWERAELVALVERILTEGGSRFVSAKPEHAASIVKYLLSRTGLLTEPQEGRIQFGHLSFQEYLAAVHLHASASARLDKASFVRRGLFERLAVEGWSEVATLFMAIDAIRTQGTGHIPLLLELDVSDPNQVVWLASILGGREVRFSSEERSWWLGLLLAASMALPPHAGLVLNLARDKDNAAPVQAWFRTACIPFEQYTLPSRKVVQSLQDTTVDAVGTDSDLLFEESSARQLSPNAFRKPLEKISHQGTAVSQLGVGALFAAGVGADFTDEELVAALPSQVDLFAYTPDPVPMLSVDRTFFVLDQLARIGHAQFASRVMQTCHVALRLNLSDIRLHSRWISEARGSVRDLQHAVAVGWLAGERMLADVYATQRSGRLRSAVRSELEVLLRAFGDDSGLQFGGTKRVPSHFPFDFIYSDWTVRAPRLSLNREMIVSLARYCLRRVETELSSTSHRLDWFPRIALESGGLMQGFVDNQDLNQRILRCLTSTPPRAFAPHRLVERSCLLVRLSLAVFAKCLVPQLTNAGLSRKDILRARTLLADRSLQGSEREQRELAECDALGILPTKYLKMAFQGKVPLHASISFEEIFEDICGRLELLVRT